jgi:hypothetical protein
MRKTKEVLRLRFELGLSQDQIARSCSISQGAVSQYLKRAQAAGVTWPLPEGWDEARLEEALYGHCPRRVYETQRPTPDFASLHQELQSHRHLPATSSTLAWRTPLADWGCRSEGSFLTRPVSSLVVELRPTASFSELVSSEQARGYP